MVQNFPRPVNPKIKRQTDDQLAKVGQLNQLVRDINELQTDPSTPTGIPFEYFPPAGLTTAGPKFTYTDGVELISYHVKGIMPVYSNDSNTIVTYLCTISFESDFFFPGSLSGMVFANDGGASHVLSPLANGSFIESEGDDTVELLSNVQVIMEAYDPQPEGLYNYAILLSMLPTGGTPPYAATVAYDIELLLPNFVAAPTIFQD
jgi:hypothetical protein